MPMAAIEATEIDCCVPAGEIAHALGKLVAAPVRWEQSLTAEQQPDRVERDPAELAPVDGGPTALSRPACGGAVSESFEGSVVRFTCQLVEHLLLTVTELGR